MAERIVSPGVFTREKDLSFLPQGIGEIGAASNWTKYKRTCIRTDKSRVLSKNFTQDIWWIDTEDSYLPYTAQSYLEDAGTATIVRVLGSEWIYKVETLNLVLKSSAGSKSSSSNYILLLK